MNHRREYEIAFVGLKPGIHEFEYKVEDKFFVPYGEQDFKNCYTHIKLTLDKKSGFMLLKFDIDGKIESACDRCGNDLPFQLWDEFTIIVKIVDDPETMNTQEEDPDIFYIGRGESHLHIANWIFEFINLSVPLQKMCNPKDLGGEQCNKEVLEKLRKMEEEAKNDKPTLWKGLEKFKDLE